MEFIEGLENIYEFLVNGSYTFVQEIFAQVAIWVGTWYFKLKLAALTFVWGVAQAAMDQLNLTSLINQYWSQLDSNFVAFLSRYNVPEAFNLVLNAHITAYLWRLL